MRDPSLVEDIQEEMVDPLPRPYAGRSFQHQLQSNFSSAHASGHSKSLGWRSPQVVEPQISATI